MIGVRRRLDHGVNFSAPTSELAPGELALARNSYYLPESGQLTKSAGRSLFASLGPITGLAFARFRSAGSFLLASAGTSYYSAPVGASDSFTARATGLSPVGRMEAAYSVDTDRVYLCDGVNAMRAWSGSGNMRVSGLSRPSAITATHLDNSATIYPKATTFYYAHTEVDDTSDSANAIESAPSEPVAVSAPVANGTFKITLPTTATNSAKTKYRIYRTQHGGIVFYRLAEIDGASTRYYDGDNTEGGGHPDNETVYGSTFKTLDDLFLSTRDVMPMLATGQRPTYVTVNGTIPIGNIFGIFQGSSYIAGVASFPHHLYFSLPGGFLEAYPPVNYIPVGVDRGEPITAAGAANDRLLIFTQNSIHRLNTFFRPTDPGFGIGTARVEVTTSDHGCIAKRSTVNFGVGQPNNRLFYLSARGPMMTDGYETWPLNQDIPWTPDRFNLSAMNLAIARNYHKLQQVWLFVPSRTSNTPDIALIYHYHPSHLKYGSVGKWTGPVHVRCDAATTAYDAVGNPLLYSAKTGGVYLEDSGTNDAANYDDTTGKIHWEWMTGDDNYGQESANRKVSRVYLNFNGTQSFSGSLKYATDKQDAENPVELQLVRENSPSTMKFGTSDIVTPKTRSYRAQPWQTGAHHRWHLSETATAARELVSMEVEVEEQGRQH